MTNLEKLLAEATPEQLASALIEARRELVRIAEVKMFQGDEWPAKHNWEMWNIARATLARIDAILGERGE